MSTTAPKPPTKRLLLAAGVSSGITIGIWAITAVGHLVFSGIPPVRLVVYAAVGLTGIAVSGWLGTRYVVQKQRRDAWWEGYSAGDEPVADVIPIRGVKGDDGDSGGFRASSPR